MAIKLPKHQNGPSNPPLGFYVRNVNEALPLALAAFKQYGYPVESRGLQTLELPGPVQTTYKNPNAMVLFDEGRDANPFFHLFEAMWILSGSRHCALPAHFLPRITDYSDDQRTFHGAYGFRLRNWPNGEAGPMDQLNRVVELLVAKPDTRQAVLSIWDPVRDLGASTKDMPCNDMLAFKVRDGKLNLTVFNRSNDAIWGAYGANVVQFSIILLWVAARVGLPVGRYTQVSDSFHVYTDLPLWKQYVEGKWAPHGDVVDPYSAWDPVGEELIPLFYSPEDATAAAQDAHMLDQMARQGTFDQAPMLPADAYRSNLGRDTLRPMLVAFACYRAGDIDGALITCERIARQDWRMACIQWLQRRQARAVARALEVSKAQHDQDTAK